MNESEILIYTNETLRLNWKMKQYGLRSSK